MLPKQLVITPSTVATTLGLGGDTNMRDNSLQIVTIEQLQAVVNQLISNGQVLNIKINNIGASKIKMPLIKRFSGKKIKLKGFLI
jgi:hypothetical protein